MPPILLRDDRVSSRVLMLSSVRPYPGDLSANHEVLGGPESVE